MNKSLKSSSVKSVLLFITSLTPLYKSFNVICKDCIEVLSSDIIIDWKLPWGALNNTLLSSGSTLILSRVLFRSRSFKILLKVSVRFFMAELIGSLTVDFSSTSLIVKVMLSFIVVLISDFIEFFNYDIYFLIN